MLATIFHFIHTYNEFKQKYNVINEKYKFKTAKNVV